MSLLLLLNPGAASRQPELVLRAPLTYGGKDPEGQLIQSVAVPWFEILRVIETDPDAAYRIEPRQWEEIIAGAYSQGV